MGRSTKWPLRIVTAAAVVVVGYGHLYLWQNGYKHTPVRQLFLLDFVAALVIAVIVLVGPRLVGTVGAVLAVGLCALTFAGFLLSRGPGVPTPNGTFKEQGYLTPTAGLHLLGANPALTLTIAEGIGFVFALALIAVGTRRRRAALA